MKTFLEFIKEASDEDSSIKGRVNPTIEKKEYDYLDIGHGKEKVTLWLHDGDKVSEEEVDHGDDYTHGDLWEDGFIEKQLMCGRVDEAKNIGSFNLFLWDHPRPPVPEKYQIKIQNIYTKMKRRYPKVTWHAKDFRFKLTNSGVTFT